MFTPRFTRAFRPAAQCLQPARKEALQRNSISHPMRQCLRQRRHASSRPFMQGSKELFKAYPYSVSAAMFFVFCGAGTLLYSNYIYQHYIIGAFSAYPEPVAKQLRKALYYTNISLEPKNAVKYYRSALQVASDMGMDPFSAEIIGIKIQIAALMERVMQFQKAIDILEIVKKDNMRWIEELGGKEGNEAKRTWVLGKTVGVSVKLGELYAGEYVMEREKAEEALVWAVETVLRERIRREKEGVKEGEGEWLSREEIGGSFEALAHHYEEKDQHYLAAPLFLQALTQSPPSSCHAAVLMNNLSISLAQQIPPPSSSKTSQPPSAPSNIPDTNLSSALAWAHKAITLTSQIASPDRTEECDIACAVATHNLAEFAEMMGDYKEAKRRFEEAGALAKAVGFQEGVQRAGEGVKRVGGKVGGEK